MAGSSSIHVDTEAPATTLSSASYDPDSNRLQLTGDNFNDILSGNATAENTELKAILDWSKLTYNIDGFSAETFTQSDIRSAKITSNNELIIELTSDKANNIENISGNNYNNDTVDVTAGFIKDLVGNEATTDGLSSAAVSQEDLQAPELNTSSVSGNDLLLSFSESLSGSPANSEFTIIIDGTKSYGIVC